MNNGDSNNRSAYNNMAEYYYEDIDKKPFNAYYERPATLSLIPSVDGKIVLDAGCAAGWYTNWLLNNGAQVTAIDLSPKMVKMCKKRVKGRAKIIQANLSKPLDFLKDKQFDIVLSSLTLHYILDLYSVMEEFYRILKKSGAFVFSVHHPFMDFSYFNSDNYFSTELLTDYWQTPMGKQKVQFYRRPLSKIILPLLQSGFNIDKLLEPMPTEKFKIEDSKTYKKICKNPQFLFIRAIKE
ncbi:MAG: class I SAM-dependent methyltransferase [Halanaerobiales bacterium]|nr:class I SAM-dependent methyltransferase [Halanaerobiales bacterium]